MRRKLTDDFLTEIQDKPGFVKFHTIPSVYYRSWLEKYNGTFLDKDVLDFGCGDGLATVGIQHFGNARTVTGVDIGNDFLSCEDLLAKISPSISIPNNVAFNQITPGTSLGSNKFDVIVSWSVLEHVSQNIFEKQLECLYEALRPGGHFVFQVDPLYYCSFGSHLFGLQEPWEHLYSQSDLLEQKVFNQCTDQQLAVNLWQCYLTLNRYTDKNFVEGIHKVGFKILESYTTYTSDQPSASLLEIYDREVLTKEQILIVCTK